MEFPRARWIRPIRFGIAVLALCYADQFGAAVACKIRERRRFVVGLVQDFMPRPMFLLALWIFKPGGVLAWETYNQDIVPAVFVEVVHPHEEVIRISVFGSQCPFKARNCDCCHRAKRKLKRGF